MRTSGKIKPGQIKNEFVQLRYWLNVGKCLTPTSLIHAEATNAHLNSTLANTNAENGNEDASENESGNDGIWLRTPASETEFGVPDYSVVDGLTITRYNGDLSSDGTECYSTSTNSIRSIRDN